MVKLSGTYVYTAGGQVALNGTSALAIEELGPLDETERGSQVYEVRLYRLVELTVKVQPTTT